MRAGLAVLVVLAWLGSSCSDRERTNPLDPGNPTTRGRPIGFAAVAQDHSVKLTWQSVQSFDIEGYRLFRRTAAETTFTELGSGLGATANQFLDLGALNGLEHRYQLHYVLSNGTISPPSETAATPGPQIPWVSDLTGGQLVQLSPDGRHVSLRSTGHTGPTCLDIHLDTGTLWFSDTFAERVGIRSPLSGQTRFVTDFDSPTGIAIDQRDNTAWIVDEERDMVFHYRANGDPAQPPFLSNFELPIAVAVDPNDGAVYVAERTGNRVRAFSSFGGARWTSTMNRPSRVAVDSLSRDVWVTSLTDRLAIRFGPSGTAIDTVGGLAGPIGIAVDGRRGRVWIADAAGDAIAVFDRDGAPLFRIGGYREVREIAIDPRTGDGWATVPRDGAVVRVSGSGVELGRVGGFLQPYDVAVHPGN